MKKYLSILISFCFIFGISTTCFANPDCPDSNTDIIINCYKANIKNNNFDLTKATLLPGNTTNRGIRGSHEFYGQCVLNNFDEDKYDQMTKCKNAGGNLLAIPYNLEIQWWRTGKYTSPIGRTAYFYYNTSNEVTEAFHKENCCPLQ
jgi:hypothetical protein